MITKRRDISAIQEVRQFIEDNFVKAIPVELLCKEFGINRTKLQEGFNQLFDISVHAYVSRLRMEKARSLLKETDESVKVVAIECGYRNISSFTRVFTRLHKVSPTQYRALTLSNIKRSEKVNESDN